MTTDDAHADHEPPSRRQPAPASDPAEVPAPEGPELQPHEVFDRVGGLPAFERLVASFYARVEQDELLRPMYPDDLEPGKRHLTLFLAQYWGGGNLYGDERGHPRLRMRHAPFPITPEAALHWAEHMAGAIGEQDFPPEVDALLLGYVGRATPTLINQLPDEVRTLPERRPR
jgi:hemoglobin